VFDYKVSQTLLCLIIKSARDRSAVFDYKVSQGVLVPSERPPSINSSPYDGCLGDPVCVGENMLIPSARRTPTEKQGS
jgi:hypothetical protein